MTNATDLNDIFDAPTAVSRIYRASKAFRELGESVEVFVAILEMQKDCRALGHRAFFGEGRITNLHLQSDLNVVRSVSKMVRS